MRNKKGSHIGVILSFVMFIIFLVFVYLIVGPPTSLQSSKENSLTFLENNVLNRIGETTIIIRSYDESSENCIGLEVPENDFIEKTLVVLDKNNQEVPSKISENNILIESKNGFTKAFLSNNSFVYKNQLSFTSCSNIEPSSILIEKQNMEKNILFVLSEVKNNYDLFKEDLEVSPSDEFNILFDYNNGTIIGDKNIDVKTSVYAKSININYLSLNAEEKIGTLIIKIW